MDDFEELWLPIKGFSERYLISNTGHVCLRADRRVRVPTKILNGEVCARFLHQNDHQYLPVNKFVLEGFHGPQKEGFTPYYLDGDRTNNSAANLRWYVPPGWRVNP